MYAKSDGFEKSLILKVSIPAQLCSVLCYNKNAAARYLQIHDSATLPANGAVPLMVVNIPAASTGSLDFEPALPFAAGIVAVLSTTDATLTITTTNDGLFLGVIH